MSLDYLKELRQNGTDRRSEMNCLISGGFAEYRAIKAAEEEEVITLNAPQLAFPSLRYGTIYGNDFFMARVNFRVYWLLGFGTSGGHVRTAVSRAPAPCLERRRA